jgi:hypothetical protein
LTWLPSTIPSPPPRTFWRVQPLLESWLLKSSWRDY